MSLLKHDYAKLKPYCSTACVTIFTAPNSELGGITSSNIPPQYTWELHHPLPDHMHTYLSDLNDLVRELVIRIDSVLMNPESR